MTFRSLMGAAVKTPHDIAQAMATYWPGRLGNHIRYWYYRRKLKHLGEGAIIDFGVHIVSPSHVSIGSNTHIDRWVTLVAGRIHEGNRRVFHRANTEFRHEMGTISIGAHVHIAPYVYMIGAGGIEIGERSGIAAGSKVFSVSNHYANRGNPNDKTLYAFSNRIPDEEQSLIIGPVVMKRQSGVGLNSVVLPGSTISEDSWVGALSCVMGKIPPQVIAAGSPARPVKRRD